MKKPERPASLEGLIEAELEAARTLHRLGDLAAAGAAYRAILARRPGHPPALHLLGNLALEVGQSRIACDLLAAAAAADPTQAGYRNDWGQALEAEGDTGAAIAQYLAALELDPRHVGAHVNLGLVAHRAGEFERAAALHGRAVEIEPSEARAHACLGAAYLAMARVEPALAELNRAVALAPDDAGIRTNLGNAWMAADRPERAEAEYRAALDRVPAPLAQMKAEIEVNLAQALCRQGRLDAALARDDAALALAPGLPAAQWNAGIDRLLAGDYARGWAGFAHRVAAGAAPPHGLTTPEWRGFAEPEGGIREGGRLLVHAEQGLGDTIQFARFLPQLRASGAAEIVLLCQPDLTGLLGRARLADRVAAPEDGIPPHDARVALLDLPLKLGVALADLPGPVPYLASLPSRRRFWATRLGGAGEKRIGLVWKGRAQHANDRHRSMPLAAAESLLGLPGIAWFSLQKAATPVERAQLAAAGVVDLAGDLEDWEETAAAIECLDLVISIDSAPAHLAGALGRPVWILLPFAPDWRWLTARSDSPWYPSARLFRQKQPQDWAGVAEAVAGALQTPAISWGAG